MKEMSRNGDVPPKFKFLDDSCSNVDLTEDKTHQRIADQLFDLIKSGDSKGLTIGLEGDWGSGKSTVVELLRQKLAKDEKTFFFYIDTWAHEGDPLRRAFLDSLIAQLKKDQSLSAETKQKLDALSAKITNRATSKKTERHSRAQKFGRAMGIAALLVPLGASLVGAVAPHVTWHWTGKICVEFWAGVGLALAPLWVFLFYLVTKRDRSLFALESTEDIIYETSLEEERSSVEFARYFDAIVRIIHPRFSKIVMVIDNLDRIDQKDALRIWSTLQTFMQRKNPEGGEGEGASRWIIVPYAYEGLEKTWRTNDEPCVGANENAVTSPPKSHPNQQDTRLASFMDKSFDLRLHLPLMVISGWKRFALDCIREAAPDLSTEQTETILDVLVLTRETLSDAPSPRQIKLYVNHVGMLWRLHHQHVSLTAVCYYVVIRYLCEGWSDAAIKQSLSTGVVPGPSLPMYAGPLGDEIASILYGVPKDKATQLLIAPLLEEGLKNSEIGYLRQLREDFSVVFDTVMYHILSHLPQNDLPKILSSIQRAFGSQAPQLCTRAFLRLKAQPFNANSMFHNMGHANSLAIIELASSNQDAELAKILAEAYIQRLPLRVADAKGAAIETVSAEEKIESGAVFIEKLRQVPIAARQEIKLPFTALEGKKFPFYRLDENEMTALASFLSNPDDAAADFAHHLNGIIIEAWMINWLSALIRQGMRKMDCVLQEIEQQFNMQHLVNGMTWGDNDHQVWELLLALDILPRNERPDDFIQNMLRSPVLVGTAKFSHPGLVYLLSKYRGDELADENVVARPPNSEIEDYENAWSSFNTKLGEKVYLYSKRSGEYEWLAREAARPTRQLTRDIIHAAVEAGEKRLFDVSAPFKFLVDAWNLTEDSAHEALLGNFMANEARLEALGKGDENLTENPHVCQILLERCEKRPVWNTLVAKCLDELRHMPQEKWRQDFEDKSMVRFIVFLQRKGVPINLGTEFYTAFRGLVEEALDGGYEPGLSFDEMAALYHAMESTFQIPFGGKVGRILLENKFDVVQGDFLRFLLEVPDYGEWLEEKPSEILDALAELAQDDDLEPMAHLAFLLARHGEKISYWGKIIKTTKPFLDQLLQHPDEEKRGWGQKIAKELEAGAKKVKRRKRQKGKTEEADSSTRQDGGE